MKKRRSFKSLLRIWIFSYAAVALILSAVLFLKYGNDEIGRRLTLAENLIQLYSDDTVSIEYGRHNLVYVADSLRRLNHLLKGKQARVLDTNGTVVESIQPIEIGSKPRSANSGITTPSAVVREHSSGDRLGKLEVLIDKNTLAVGAFKNALTPALLLLFGLTLLSLLIIRSLQRKLIRPIRQLLSTRTVSQSDSDLWPTEIRDLSVRLEKELKQREFAMIGQFSSSILHDIKTSLNSLKTAVELIRESGRDSDKYKLRLELLLSAAAQHVPKMDAIVTTTLDGSREIKVRPTHSDIKATLERSISGHADMIQKYHVDLQVSTQELSAPVPHDPVQMERVFSNILKNAIEATADEKSNPNRSVSIRATQNKDSVTLAFDDSGPGLKTSPDELLTSIRTTKLHGSGLGLWVSRKIVEAHQGVLTPSKSDHLGGARFAVKVPFVQESRL